MPHCCLHLNQNYMSLPIRRHQFFAVSFLVTWLLFCSSFDWCYSNYSIQSTRFRFIIQILRINLPICNRARTRCYRLYQKKTTKILILSVNTWTTKHCRRSSVKSYGLEYIGILAFIRSIGMKRSRANNLQAPPLSDWSDSCRNLNSASDFKLLRKKHFYEKNK